MNFLPQPCEFPRVSGHTIHHGMTKQNGQGQVLGGQAPSEFARLGAKQGHATSATFSSKLHFYFRTFAHSCLFTIQHPHVSASRNRGGKFNIHNRHATPLTPSSLNPLTPRYCVAAFTLIELMAATTVLSVVLLMMVGMQDQMSKAWSNSNRRTDATREARAACRLMAQDLSSLVFRRTNNDSADSIPAALLTQGIPFLYSSNGTGPITIPSKQPSASYFFGLSARKPSGSGPEDLGIFGYYIASTSTTNVSGFVTTNFNLYRHYVPASNAVNNLNTWFSSTTKDAGDLFNPTNAEILARNTCNLRITFYNRRDASGSYAVTNGLNYSCESGGTATYFSGNKIQVEISVYPEDFAQRIPYTDWEKSENIRKFARSYEFRIDLPRE
jgi:type II secretory pathway component PulJ